MFGVGLGLVGVGGGVVVVVVGGGGVVRFDVIYICM